MKRSLVFALSILAALAVAAPVIAQTDQTASGTVVSASGSQIVIRAADGTQMTFMTDADTNRPADLQAGAPVTVRYHDMNGTLHAANVSAGSTPSSTGTASSPTTTAPSTAAPSTPSTTTTPSTSSTMPSTTTPTTSSTRPAADPTGNDARMPQTPSSTTTRVQDPATTAAPAPPTGTSATAAEDTDTARMPATASPLPLIGLSGLFALAGGVGTRLLRRRT